MWLDHALRASEADLVEQQARADRLRVEQERVNRAAAEDAMKRADEALAEGRLEELDAVLAESREVMEPLQRRYYLERIAAGGGFGNAQTNREAYVELFDRTSSGENMRDEIDAAFRKSLLSREDRDRLLTQSEATIFRDAEQFLAGATQQSEYDFKPAAALRAQQARAMFLEWSRRNRGTASAEEAMEKARDLAGRASLIDLEEFFDSHVLPRHAVGRGLDFDPEATRARTIEAFRRKHGLSGNEPLEQANAVLLADPEFMDEAVLIQRLEEVLARHPSRFIGPQAPR